MSAVCVTCAGYLKNTGVPAGVKPFGRIWGMYYVPLTADDGTRNSFDTGAVDLNIELLERINDPDPSKRWYPLLDLKTVTPSKEDDTFATDDAQQQFKTLDGRESISFERWGATRQEFAQLEDVCVEFGVVLMDNCGNLLGEWDEATDKLYPRDVNEDSYSSRYMNATATDPAKIMISFDYDIVTSEADQIMLSVDSFTTVTPLKLRGMIDVNIVVVSVDSATQVTVQTNYNYGTVGALLPFKGASASDFDLFNNTTSTSIGAPSGLASTATDGEYELTLAAQTALDVVQTDIFRAATANNENGFDGVPTTFVAQ
jgi:hypothetical protein